MDFEVLAMTKHYLLPTIALSFLMFTSGGSFAQCGIHPQASEGPTTLQYNGGESGTVMSVAYNAEFDLYYANHGGSTSASIVTFDNSGSEISQVQAGFDYRGLWWNENTDQLEGNGFDFYGILSKDYNETNGIVDQSGGSILLGPNQPSNSSIGSLDTMANEIIYVFNSTIYRYDRSDNSLIESVAITGLPNGTGNLNGTGLIYGPCEDRNVGVYEYAARIVHFVDVESGEYVSSSQLPGDAPTPANHGIDFANGYAWIYDSGSNSWKSYDVINTDCQGQQFTEQASICEGDSILLGGEYRFDTGTYFDVYINQAGCDSTILTELTVNESVTTGDAFSICEGDSTLINGEYVSEAGNYTDTLSTIQGCDSIISVSLSIAPTFTGSDEAAICEGDSILLGGEYRFEAGTYADTLTAINGCDSIVDVELSLNSTYSFDDQVTICEGDSALIGGEYQMDAGIYTEEFSTVQGCDSIYNTELIVNQNVENSVSEQICAGDSLLIGEEYETEAGTYMAVFESSTGCDSTVTVELSVTELDTEVEQAIDMGVQVANPIEEADYQWLDCDQGLTAIDNANSVIYDGMNGNFAFEVSAFGCTDTSDCILLTGIGFEDISRSDFEMYPNPASSNLFISKQVEGEVRMEIYDITGKMVSDHLFTEQRKTIDISGMRTGAYMIRFTHESGVVTERLVVR